MLASLKSRIVTVSTSLAVAGELAMYGAGLYQLYLNGINASDLVFATGAFLSLYGQVTVLLLGNKWLESTPAAQDAASKFSIKALAKPFMPWKYPMDSAYALFVIAAFCYYLTGLSYKNPALILFSTFMLFASSLGWVWPRDRKISGYEPSKIINGMLLVGSVAVIAAGAIGHMYILIGAGVFHLLANILPIALGKPAPAPQPAEGSDETEDEEPEDEPKPAGKKGGKR
ncbi:MAG: hypothetical protein KGQ41_09760 [Alphaproteobacteria bacterium]|nr:hypothetical protein [Alphaproteobacteria bacterium]